MVSGKFVSYYRVSTRKQGESGLGLDAQKAMVAGYLNGRDCDVVAEYVEIESGKNDARPKLAAAMARCKKEGATLLIAKLDRLARSVHLIAGMMKSNVPFVAVESPNDDAFTLHIKAAVAEKEAKDIGNRTKAALAAAKARGTVLGGRRVSAERWAEIVSQGNQQRSLVASKRANSMIPVIDRLKKEGAVTLRDIAAGLNDRGFTTPKGKQWTAVQVMRVLASEDKAIEAAFA